MDLLKYISVFLLIFLGACSVPEPPNGNFPPQHYEIQEASEATVNEEGVSQVLHPHGWWASLRINSQCIVIPGTKHPFEMYHYSINVMKMEADESERQVKLTATTCTMGDTPMLGLATKYPKALIDTVNPWEVEGILTGVGPGEKYVETPRVEKWGVKLDPYKDQFPADPQDEHIWDQDKDGKPGATLIMGKDFCEIYLAQYTIRQFYGELVSGIRIEGKGHSRGEKMIIDASDPFCKPKNEVIPNDDYSMFVMVRVDGKDGSINLDKNGDGRVSCEELLTRWQELFTLPEIDDKHCEWVLEGK